MIENIIKKKFSLSWRWFYRMQIPLIIGYHKFFQDLTTFHIWGTICMNQVLNVSKLLDIEKDNEWAINHLISLYKKNNKLFVLKYSEANISFLYLYNGQIKKPFSTYLDFE